MNCLRHCRSIFVVALAICCSVVALPSCGSSSSGTTNPGASAVNVLGFWSFTATTTADSPSSCHAPVGDIEMIGAEIQSFGGALTLELTTEGGDVLAFEAVLSGRTLTLSGTSPTGGGTASLLPGSTLTLSASGASLDGTLQVRSEETSGTCLFTLDIAGVRPSTPSTIQGPWELRATTTVANGACGSSVGDIEILDVTFIPISTGRFQMDVTIGSGDVLRFDADVLGAVAFITGTATGGGETATMLAGSELTIGNGVTTLIGTLVVRLENGNDVCMSELAIQGTRTPEADFIPFLRDVEGERRFVGIHAEAGGTTLDFDARINDSVDAFAALSGSIARAVDRSKFSRATGMVSDHRRSQLYYTDGGDVFSLDLGIRRDAFGMFVPPTSQTVFQGSGSPIQSLRAFGGFRDLDAVIQCYTDDSETHVIEVARNGAITSSSIPGDSFPIAPVVRAEDRSYAGLVIVTLTNSAQTAELRLVRNGGSELIASQTMSALVTEQGDILYLPANGNSVRRFDPQTGQSLVVDDTPGSRFVLGAVDGGDMYYLSTRNNTPGTIQVKVRAADGQVSQLAEITPPTGQAELVGGSIKLTDDFVAVQYQNTASGSQLASVSKGGGNPTFLGPMGAPLGSERVLTMGNRIYYLTSALVGTGSARSRGMQSPQDMIDLGRDWLASIPSDEYTLGTRRPVEGLILLQSDGSIAVLGADQPPQNPVLVSIAQANTADFRNAIVRGNHVAIGDFRSGGGGSFQSAGVTLGQTDRAGIGIVVTDPPAASDIVLPPEKTIFD